MSHNSFFITPGILFCQVSGKKKGFFTCRHEPKNALLGRITIEGLRWMKVGMIYEKEYWAHVTG